MKTYITKLKHIVPTFMIIALLTISGILFLRWILAIRFDILDIKEEMWCFWLPVTLPWIPVLIWLRPRLRILTFKKDTDNRRFFFQFLAVGTIAVSLMVAQNFLTTSTGELKELPSIKDIGKNELVRYYKLKDFHVTDDFGGTYTNFRQSGKYNQHLNFDIYFVVPILENSSVKINTIPRYWYGVNFKKEISNNISNEEKEKKYHAFYQECAQKMDTYDYYTLDHFERTPTSEDRKYYLAAVQSRFQQTAGDNFIVLEPVKEKYEDRNGNKFAWIFYTFGIGLGIFLFSLIWPGYSESQRKNFLAGKKPKSDDLRDAINFLIPKGAHFASSVVIDLNLLVYIIMIFSGISIFSANGTDLLEWGANRRQETTSGEWWRLFTSMFLHGGIMHLIMNITALVLASIFIEPILGRKKYFIIYIIAGLCGSLASIMWYPNTISVGASGAIFGLFGAILGHYYKDTSPDREANKGFITMTWIYVGINLFWGLFGSIDNAAHIGGLLAGLAIGMLLNNPGESHES
ncbi:rhomboid family intramembrane serine protease [Flavobacterium amniphilum]|uniref:rhomboid family intramembrane serine protease n=1 Tax=Flavobacterium amniphilum TaxID=1834035 RepID=UPI00202AA101|nr:rhomboid family intramembrane serine protease [Flavobacterium amniphilum]MCL9805488.1 rhomboid family intramembrane serine protease [Flavobacterium amniphilum]